MILLQPSKIFSSVHHLTADQLVCEEAIRRLAGATFSTYVQPGSLQNLATPSKPNQIKVRRGGRGGRILFEQCALWTVALLSTLAVLLTKPSKAYNSNVRSATSTAYSHSASESTLGRNIFVYCTNSAHKEVKATHKFRKRIICAEEIHHN